VTSLYLLEPAVPGAAWAPFGGVRPVAELRAGRWRIRERWERALGLHATGILGTHCDGFSEDDEPPCTAPLREAAGPAIVAASWFAPAASRLLSIGPEVRRLVHEDVTVAWVVPAGAALPQAGDQGPSQGVDGLLLPGAYALLDALERFLPDDCVADGAASGAVPEGALVLGDRALVRVLPGAAVEPGVVFDVRHGAILIEAGAEVRHGTRLEGPVWVGSGTRVLGGDIRGSALGPHCRVRGEVSASVFMGYANKGHEGFVGHSVVGRWVNLGAGTTTSNLKNTYGPVRLDVGTERIETGRLNVGTLFGDHAKTAIGTLLGTGTVVGAGANVFGGTAVPKYVPPFAWGSDGTRMTEEGFLRVAERVMARREVAFTEARRGSLQRTYARGVQA
jgi:UDP-N-acetylglucosamine diphosphorylase/glucosamine-1-phosphate N-acetyltransferase